MPCTPEQANEIVAQVGNGRTVTSVCKELGISFTQFYYFLRSDTFVLQAYADAQDTANTLMENEIIDIADNPDLDHNHRRAMMDARMKVLGARQPHRWGQKIDLTVNTRPSFEEAERKAQSRLTLRPDSDLRLLPLAQAIDAQLTIASQPADYESVSAPLAVEDDAGAFLT
jgi:hypothetical protein